MTQPNCNHDLEAHDGGACECGARVPAIYEVIETRRYVVMVPADYSSAGDDFETRGESYFVSKTEAALVTSNFPFDVTEREAREIEPLDGVGYCVYCGRKVSITGHWSFCPFAPFKYALDRAEPVEEG